MADTLTLLMVLRIAAALIFGMIIGAERVTRHRAAGIRTYALVSMAAALFVVISELVINSHAGHGSLGGLISVSPVAIIASVVTGIGFLGAGLIIHIKDHVENLTTASALWAAAAIGVACGFGYLFLALCVTFMTLFILSGTRGFETWLKNTVKLDPGDYPPEKK